MSSIEFKLPVGNRAQVGTMTLRSNGKVDREEGNIPPEGLRDILDNRVEQFISSSDSKELGSAWRDYDKHSAVISGNFGKEKPSVASQLLHVDKRRHTVTIQTQDAYGPQFNHWIEAKYDKNNHVNPRTITEWVSH